VNAFKQLCDTSLYYDTSYEDYKDIKEIMKNARGAELAYQKKFKQFRNKYTFGDGYKHPKNTHQTRKKGRCVIAGDAKT